MPNNLDLPQVVDLVAVPMPLPKTLTHSTVSASKDSSAKVAIRHCCEAWRRASEAYRRSNGGKNANEFLTAKRASQAYCKAMPVLEGEKGIRDFIACAAHGIIIGAIPEKRGGQVFYAAQVALAALHSERIPPESTSRPTPP